MHPEMDGMVESSVAEKVNEDTAFLVSGDTIIDAAEAQTFEFFRVKTVPVL